MDLIPSHYYVTHPPGQPIYLSSLNYRDSGIRAAFPEAAIPSASIAASTDLSSITAKPPGGMIPQVHELIATSTALSNTMPGQRCTQTQSTCQFYELFGTVPEHRVGASGITFVSGLIQSVMPIQGGKERTLWGYPFPLKNDILPKAPVKEEYISERAGCSDAAASPFSA